MRYSMTPEQARQARRTALQAAVGTAVGCTTLTPDAFFREDGEPQIVWKARRAEAIQVCAECPVRAACEELALRDGDGRADADDMVRGGLTGPELASARARQATRLASAIDTDRDVEGKRLDNLTVELQRTVLKNTDKAGGHRSADRAQAAQNSQVRLLAGQIRDIQIVRRARAGWNAA